MNFTERTILANFPDYWEKITTNGDPRIQSRFPLLYSVNWNQYPAGRGIIAQLTNQQHYHHPETHLTNLLIDTPQSLTLSDGEDHLTLRSRSTKSWYRG